jgi:hypothetical protein
MKAVKRLFTIGLILWFSSVTSANADILDSISLEANYILSCQFTDPSNSAYGAINNVLGNPTWIVPGENAIAIMGLVTAAKMTGNNVYLTGANLAADYLMSVQDTGDGAWFDQYEYSTAYSSAKSLRHTAEVMIAYNALGYDTSRYDSMMDAAGYLLMNQDIANKGGNDDGLVGGGKDASGNYHTWRWTSDNAFAYQALNAASDWAQMKGDSAYAQELEIAAGEILDGINNYLVSDDHWKRVIDSVGNDISEESYGDWISYAPLMLDLPIDPTAAAAASEWIHDSLQLADGSVVWGDTYFNERKSPGYSFQAMLAWLDTGHSQYATDALAWAENSGLWYLTPNENEIPGGWIDWIENGQTPENWQRFIDTSSYYIMVRNGGYDFGASTVLPEPSTLFMFLSGFLGILGFRRKK